MTIATGGALLLAGAGRMGGALLAGWLDHGLDPAKVFVQDPALPPETAARLAAAGVRCAPAFSVLPVLDVLVLAVKPQVMDAALPPLSGFVSPATLVVSIAAGRTIASIARHVPPGTAIVRAMPNTPAAIGRGMTVCCGNAAVTPAQLALCQDLLSAVGEADWVTEEADMDAVTAVSGSGPAYVFLLAECLAAAAREEGLNAALAGKLARVTVAGAGELLLRRGECEPARLREEVTSPGGTTAAALAVLMGKDGGGDGLGPLLRRAVAAAARRSRELAK